MVLGPSSSRLVKTTSVFVQQVQVRDESDKGALVYGFTEKPELSKEVTWNSSSYLIVGSYDRKGNSFWLNKGKEAEFTIDEDDKYFAGACDSEATLFDPEISWRTEMEPILSENIWINLGGRR
ncbi:hypothetical protein F3Y22_tig00112647pilonHSYRG00016 [Hibiscus syriacus]|uniref:E3 ubiquitin-protein ligase APD1-4 N-terminal domain-containing protein n=1 Tax=Hibiscus syriacus TaxID=106335 RepID=A0A6A2WUM4_HIBSY|nr:hypothetical protein F3Y22_tig00112647pilonHSYRG00016 [Hibiscus syriacus]